MNKRQYRKNIKSLLLIEGRTGKGTGCWNMDTYMICYKRFKKSKAPFKGFNDE